MERRVEDRKRKPVRLARPDERNLNASDLGLIGEDRCARLGRVRAGRRDCDEPATGQRFVEYRTAAEIVVSICR